MNNPLRYVDPTGMTIWLAGENGENTKYEPGQKGDDTRIKALATMYGKKEGKSVIDKLHSAGENYYILPENNNGAAILEGANGLIYPLEGGGYNIEWGTPGDYHGGSSENVLAEELYHGFQEYGPNGYIPDKVYSVQDEVKAKEFSTRMFGGFQSYFYNEGYYHPTQMNIMRGGDSYNRVDKADFLQGKAILNIFSSDPSSSFGRRLMPSGTVRSPKAY